MDPTSLTREQYTDLFLRQAIPAGAQDRVVAQALDLRDMLSKLASHTAMVDSGNMQQSYSTVGPHTYYACE